MLDTISWLLSSVFASTDYKEWKELRHEISTLLRQGIPSLVIGDFSCIDSSQEKRGRRAFMDGVETREFREFIKENGLVDLGFFGP